MISFTPVRQHSPRLVEFRRPMDVVEATGIPASQKLSILKAWEADERALQRAEDEGMGGGEHAHLHRVQEALARLPERAPRIAEQRTENSP